MLPEMLAEVWERLEGCTASGVGGPLRWPVISCDFEGMRVGHLAIGGGAQGGQACRSASTAKVAEDSS